VVLTSIEGCSKHQMEVERDREEGWRCIHVEVRGCINDFVLRLALCWYFSAMKVQFYRGVAPIFIGLTASNYTNLQACMNHCMTHLTHYMTPCMTLTASLIPTALGSDNL
jgi:hypothetical protein